MSALTRSLPGVDSNVRRGRDKGRSSIRLGSTESTPQRDRGDHRTGGSLISTLVHSIAHEATYLRGSSFTKEDVGKFFNFLERYDGNGEYMQGGVMYFILIRRMVKEVIDAKVLALIAKASVISTIFAPLYPVDYNHQES